MGRVLVIDKTIESVLVSISERWRVGLLVGCVTEQKDYAVHFASTPLEDSDKAKSLTSLPDVLVTSHAQELQRMLPGGLCICGVVAIGTDLGACHTRLQQVMMTSYKVCKADQYGLQTDTWQLVLVDSLTKQISSRSLLVSDYKSALKPSEVKFQPLNSGWIHAETSVSVDRTFYLQRRDQDQHFEQQLLGGLLPYLETVTNSLCLHNGRLCEEDELLGLSDSGKGKKSSAQNITPTNIKVQLLGRTQVPSSSSCDEMVSSVGLKGVVSAIAFLRAPATASRVAEAIKSDLKKSIALRCQLLCEDILQVGSERHTSEEQIIYETPPRVYIPHANLPILFNDYLFKDEKTEDCAERAQQLLGVERIDSSTINSRVERGANTADIELYLHSLNDDTLVSSETVEAVENSFTRRIGGVASVVAGAAVALAVSFSYLNTGDWFG